MIKDELLSHLDSVRPRGRGKWSARCPAHDDREPSLSIAEGERGWLLKCWAGCSLDEICSALALEQKDLFYDALDMDPRRRQEAARRRTEERKWLDEKRHREGLRLDVQREAERLIASARNIDISGWSDDQLNTELNRMGTAYAVLEGDPYHEH